MGREARTHLTKWVKDLEFDGSQESGGAGQAQQVVSRVLGAMAQGALSYNLKTCLKQLPAMFSSMADMSPSDAMKGFIGALANPGQLAEIWKSPTIQQRMMQGMSPEMRPGFDGEPDEGEYAGRCRGSRVVADRID